MDFKIRPVQEQIMKCPCGKCRSMSAFAEIRNGTAAPRGHVFMVQMLRDKVEPHQEVYDHLAKCLLCETQVNCPSGIDT